MAGNVKEWCWNQNGSDRYILGGAWNDSVYMFLDDDAHRPLDRLPTYGFRLVQSPKQQPFPRSSLSRSATSEFEITGPKAGLRRRFCGVQGYLRV